jgi:hypothetical protein
MNNLPEYFSLFPGFQFAWDREKYDNYPEAFYALVYPEGKEKQQEHFDDVPF